MNTEFIKRAGRYVQKRGTASLATGGGLSLAGIIGFGYNLSEQVSAQRASNSKQWERITAMEKVQHEQDRNIDRLKWELERKTP